MPAPPPFLGQARKASYLESKGYGLSNEISDESWALLGQTNFHYFLGYARNYRALANAGKVPSDRSIDRVVEIVRLDQKLSSVLFSGLKTFEWRLRASAVSGHCELHPTHACFLREDHFHTSNASEESTPSRIRSQTLRSKEPFLVQHFQESLQSLDLPATTRPTELSTGHQDSLLRELPIWTMVDNWSLGLLVRFTVLSRAPSADRPRLLKLVAEHFGVSAQVAATQLESLIALRNLVAHHSRLWMRTSTFTPKFPRRYARQARGSDTKSVYLVVLALATFLQADGTSKQLLADVDALLDSDPPFSLGIKRPLVLK